MHTKLIFAAFLLFPAAAEAGRPEIDPSSLMIEELPAAVQPAAAAPARAGGNRGIIIHNIIINLAFTAWDVIERNRPVVNINSEYADAVPKGLEHWTQLTGWRGPDSKLYRFTAKNSLGMTAVNAVYKVRYVWNGSYEGRGRYLTGVTIEPQSIETYWGTTVDLSVEVPDSALGNAGTSEDPVSVMELRMTWKVGTLTKQIEQKAAYRIYGDSRFEEIGPLFERARKEKTALAPAENSVPGLGEADAVRLDAVKKMLESPRFD